MDLFSLFSLYTLSMFSVYFIVFSLMKGKYYRDCFTRLVSSYIAIRCSAEAIKTLFQDIQYNEFNYHHFFYEGDTSLIKMLYLFAAYLLVDGTFVLSDIFFDFHKQKKIDYHGLVFVIHHFVGFSGIYQMAKQRIGLALGIYFAFTEISTPFLNLSWYLYTNKKSYKLAFIIFSLVFVLGRICTIPFLFWYIKFNQDIINQMDWVNFLLAYGGSLVLIILNLSWFFLISKNIFSFFFQKERT